MSPDTTRAGPVAVTGATGFIGGSVVQRLRRAGRPCVTLGRRPVGENVPHRRVELGSPPPAITWDGIDVLVHCAWDLTAVSAEQMYERNVVGSVDLFRTAVAAGVRRIVFISSMSAYAGTRQLYGRSKLDVERQVTELSGVSLRPGLVWGTGAGGMVAAVQKLTALPLVPVLGRKSYQYTAHRDDIDRAVEIAVDDDSLTGVVGVAHPDRVPLPQLLRGLAEQGDAETTGRLVTVPWHPVYWAMRAAHAARLPLPLRADSVLGLVRPAPEVARVDVWSARGLDLRAFSTDRAPSGHL